MSKQLGIRVTEEDTARLNAEAKKRGMSKSILVRAILADAGIIEL